jgi:tetratricopeptide (TPR) repeat protein
LKNWFLIAATLMLLLFILMTERQLRYWRDSETLFNHSLAVVDSAAAHASLAAALQGQNRISEATSQYIMALRLDPEMDLAYWNLAKIFGDEGKLELAALYYREGLKRNPPSAIPYDNLGVVLVELKQTEQALNEFNHAAKIDPTAAEPHFLMGRLLLQLGRDVQASAELRRATELDPDNAEILIFTASVLAADQNAVVRDGKEALRLSRKAIDLTNNQQPAAFDALAMGSAENGDFGAATLEEIQAIKLAQAIGQKDDITAMQQHLNLYEHRQPLIEPFKAN